MKADYDSAVDILYVNVGEPVPIEGDGLPRGVELDFAMDTGEPCGVTVIGFKRNGWDASLPDLLKIVSNHLSVPTRDLRGAIQTAVRQ